MMKLRGSKELMKQLEEIKDKAKEEIDGRVELKDLLSDDFLEKYTDFTSFENLFESLPVKIESQEELNNLDETKVNPIIQEKTKFSTWSELMQMAANYYAEKKLDKLL